MSENRSNWAGNYAYSAANLYYPETVEQVQGIVSRSKKLKALGTRHSFNGIADSPGDLISLERFERLFILDPVRRTVTVDAGARYGQVCQLLHRVGYALPNLASLPHISIAGACATATHGSGDSNGNLATAISALEFVTADGSLAILFRDEHRDHFSGAVVGLGGLGIVTKLTLDIVPAFHVAQSVYEDLPFAELEEHFDEITSSGYSVSLFTNWQNERINQVWVKRLLTSRTAREALGPQPELFGARLAPVQRHPIPGLLADACTEQLGVPGPWCDRLPHFRMAFTPSSGEELQSEYLVPRQHAVAAFRAIAQLSDQISPILQISEIRTIAADNLWMSPCYHQRCAAIHFTWKKDWDMVRRLLPMIEEQLAPFDARPHWGKLFTMSAESVQSCYKRLSDFRRLLDSYDPQRKFRNPFLDTYVL